MPIPARLQTKQAAAGDRRFSPRHELRLGSSVDGEPVTIHDLSITGMLIETAANLHPFNALEMQLPEAGTTSAVVVWCSGRYFGCEFKEPLSRGAVSAARLRSSPAVAIEVTQPQLPLNQVAETADERNDSQPHVPVSEQKASVAVRLQVIFGSALILWALIIWVIAIIVESFHGNPGR
jgi:hypothetical protein